ncbi:hypothetical protein Tco_0371345 [Tanacetum coccineum]
MSDSEDSTVTYTAVSSPFRGLSDIGSPGVDGPPVMPEDLYAYMIAAFQAPPSPDYVSGPKYLPSPDFVPELVYPEFMPPEDEVLPAEEQPLPATLSPTTDSPGYVLESDPEEDPEEDDDKDPEEDPTDYRADGGDDGDDEDESSDDDEDDDVDIEGDGRRRSTQLLSTLQLLPYQLLIMPYLLRRLSRLRLTTEAPSTSHSPPPHIILSHTKADTPPSGTLPSGTPPLLPIPLPTSSAPLHLLSTDHRADKPEVTLLPRKRLGIALGLRYEVRESSYSPTARPPRGFRADYGFVATIDREIRQDLERYVGYGITDTWEEMLVDMLGAPATDDTELGRQMTEFTTRVRDRRAHARTTLLMEREARMSQEAWGRSMDASDLARSEVMSLRTIVLGQQAVITELQEMINQGFTAALAARDADRNTNGNDSHNSGTGVRRTERTAHECTYTDFLKCQPLNFKGTERVASLS